MATLKKQQTPIDVAVLQRASLDSEIDDASDDYAELFLQSRDLMCIAGLDDGYFKRINPAWTARLGWSIDELKSRPFIEFVHPNDRERTMRQVSELVDGSEAVHFDNRYRHLDGSYRWLRWNASPVPGRQRIYAIARDVTMQRWIERETLEILDDERERLGREMHDGLCQTLAGIAALSAAHAKKLADPTESATAKEISDLLQASIREAHGMALNLGPARLVDDGLDQSLDLLARNTEHQFAVNCAFECQRPVTWLDANVKLHLFRIAQEAVSNAVAHARPELISINLSCTEGQGYMSIRDNGLGLPDVIGKTAGIGMHTMQHRAQLIGASLEVQRRDDKGTRVSCVFPVSKSSDDEGESDHARDKL